MEGEVVHVSPQASAGSSRGGPPSFDVTVVVEQLGAADRQRLRLGMSADVEVEVRDEARALLVPLAAVHTEGEAHWVNVRIDEDRFERVQVKVGETTLDSVEVLKGIEAGDESWRSPRTSSELPPCRTVGATLVVALIRGGIKRGGRGTGPVRVWW